MTQLSASTPLSGQIDRARDLASRGLTLTRDAGNRHGVAWAQRALGRIARGEGGLSEAEARLEEGLQAFASIHARFEAARTHLDLAELAAARGDPGAVSTRLTEAPARSGPCGSLGTWGEPRRSPRRSGSRSSRRRVEHGPRPRRAWLVTERLGSA